MKLFVLSVVLAVFATSAAALDPNEMFDDPQMEQRAREIGRELRCLKCRNQSIFDSNAGIAKDLRVVVRERITAGDSDSEILEYVRDRFGDYVLMKPPVERHTFILWLTPVLLLAIGGMSAAFYLGGRKTPLDAPELDSAAQAEAQRILKNEVG